MNCVTRTCGRRGPVVAGSAADARPLARRCQAAERMPRAKAAIVDGAIVDAATEDAGVRGRMSTVLAMADVARRARVAVFPGIARDGAGLHGVEALAGQLRRQDPGADTAVDGALAGALDGVRGEASGPDGAAVVSAAGDSGRDRSRGTV